LYCVHIFCFAMLSFNNDFIFQATKCHLTFDSHAPFEHENME
jgi:hypothetical protein